MQLPAALVSQSAASIMHPQRTEAAQSALDSTLTEFSRTLDVPHPGLPPELAELAEAEPPEELDPAWARGAAQRVREAADMGDLDDLNDLVSELKAHAETRVFGDEIARLSRDFDFEGMEAVAVKLEG